MLASAQAFAHVYADELGRKYSGLKPDKGSENSAPAAGAQPISEERVYTTNEGPVVITTRGKLVFVAESFPLDTARKLTTLILDAQGSGAMQTASAKRLAIPPVTPGLVASPNEPLSASFVRFLANCGVMKAAAEAALTAGRR